LRESSAMKVYALIVIFIAINVGEATPAHPIFAELHRSFGDILKSGEHIKAQREARLMDRSDEDPTVERLEEMVNELAAEENILNLRNKLADIMNPGNKAHSYYNHVGPHN